MNALVSIVTPTYNSAQYLEQTVRSVLHQTYNNWELLIIDDASTDNSRDIALKYMNADGRIKLIALDVNVGVAMARNIGIEASKGRYIAFLDSDDLWHPAKLSRQIAFMEHYGHPFTFTSYEWIDGSGKKLNRVIRAPREICYRSLLGGNPIGCLTVVIDQRVIGKPNMPKVQHEDYATWLEVTKSGIIAHGLNENLALYRKTRTSLSSNKIRAIKWTWDIFRRCQGLSLAASIKYTVAYMYRAAMKYVQR